MKWPWNRCRACGGRGYLIFGNMGEEVSPCPKGCKGWPKGMGEKPDPCMFAFYKKDIK